MNSNTWLRKLLACIVVILVLTPNAFSSVKFKRSFAIDFTKFRGSETAKELVLRVRKNLKTEFTIDPDNFTYNFLERYLQLYSNEPKGVMDKPVILSTKYNAKKDVTNSQIEVHYHKNDMTEVASTVVNSQLKIIKNDNPYMISFELQSNYGWLAKQLIAVYLSFGDGSRFIQDFTKTTITYNPKKPNLLTIELDYIAYGNSLKESVIEKEIVYTRNVATKFIQEIRL